MDYTTEQVAPQQVEPQVATEIRVSQEALLKALGLVIGVVEQSQVLQILSHVRVLAQGDHLRLTATDSEVELWGWCELSESIEGVFDITLPGKKLLDICRSLQGNPVIRLTAEADWAMVRSGASRFKLATLPSSSFPQVQMEETTEVFQLTGAQLHYLVSRTRFAMANQDVRYFLNGMLLAHQAGEIRAVATNGHRLALNRVQIEPLSGEGSQVILPRKTVGELARLVENNAETSLQITLTAHHVRVEAEGFILISNLLDGRYPNYEKVIPNQGDKEAVIPVADLKQALVHATLLSNEKIRGGRLTFSQDVLKITAMNAQKEMAEEEVPVSFSGMTSFEIGFNLMYLLDVLNVVQTDAIHMTLSSPESMALIQEEGSSANSVFVVMPLSL